MLKLKSYEAQIRRFVLEIFEHLAAYVSIDCNGLTPDFLYGLQINYFMKDYRIVYIKGEPKVVEWPKEPKKWDYESGGDRPYSEPYTSPDYYDALKAFKLHCESAIAKGVPPADKSLVEQIIRSKGGFKNFPLVIQDGATYSLEGYEVKIEKRLFSIPTISTKVEKSVAIITPKEKEIRPDEQGTMYY